MRENTMTWLYKNKQILDEDIPEKSLGFIYKITHPSTGRWYIGRKALSKYKTTQKNNIKIKAKVDSDWRTYWSSSIELQKLVISEGAVMFTREILLFCETKASLTYSEEFSLYSSGALFDPLCINGNIRAKIFKKWFMKCPTLHQDLVDLNLKFNK